MNRLRLGLGILRELGPRWVCFRLRYAWSRRRRALERRTPPAPWPDAPLGDVSWFAPYGPVGAGGRAAAGAIAAGKFRLFSHHESTVGLMPDWHSNPLTGESAPGDRHWSKLGDFSFGDIKGIWELSRFPWAFALGRAYAGSREESWAERFWLLFEDWLRRNPPNVGPNWMCGQEATFRMLAAIWAADVMRVAAASTPERRARLGSFVLTTGRRIAANLDYALSQANNHGVSECVGLVTAALRCPQAGEANRWLERGMRDLERQLAALVYPDGGFSQHSAVYHRVLLHDLIWIAVVLRRAGRPVPQWLEQAAWRALEHADAFTDPETGMTPHHGPNDGADILPLSDCPFLDFRPVLQAGYAVFSRRRRFAPGPWDEPAVALAEPGWDRAEVVVRPGDRRHFPDAGMLVWTDRASRLCFRCPTRFLHRPAQADLLHVDVVWKGEAITRDFGTFSYNSRGRFAGAGKEAELHNTLAFDGREPMQKAGRFLYLPWPRGRVESPDGRSFAAEHNGWADQGIRHVRTVIRQGEGDWLVVDEITARGRHRVRAHWLLVDLPCRRAGEGAVVLETAKGPYRISWQCPNARVSVVCGDPATARGWWAPAYAHAEPAISLAIETEFSDSLRIETRFSPE